MAGSVLKFVCIFVVLSVLTGRGVPVAEAVGDTLLSYCTAITVSVNITGRP